MFGHKQSKEEEEEEDKKKRKKTPSFESAHTEPAGPTTRPGREKLANLVMNEYLQYYFHYKM